MSPLSVHLVGVGERAEAWRLALVGAPRVRMVSESDGVPETLPSALIVAALGPRDGLALALALAEGGRRGLVDAPLDDRLADRELPAAAAAVKVSSGWTAAGGMSALRAKASSATAARVEVAGLPDGVGLDLDECLWHGLALVRAIFGEVALASARASSELTLELLRPARDVATAAKVELVVRLGAPRAAVSIEAGGTFRWSLDDAAESLEAPGQPARRRPAVPRATRGLAALTEGSDLFEAREVARLVRAVRLRIGDGTCRRSLAVSARRLASTPSDLSGALGLRGTLEASAPAPRIPTSHLDAPFELWGYRAGHKPVAFLTVAPDAVDRTLAFFPGAHVVRRDRRVEVGAQDAWNDLRDRGTPRVELYVSGDRALAERAAELQAGGDPTASLEELGALLGYPPCCVAAFRTLPDRANNTLHRYAAAGRTRGSRWPAALNNLSVVVSPWYPCRYDCEASLERAEAALLALDAAMPGERARLLEVLRRPVLYFTHDHQIVLDGHASETDEGRRVAYTNAAIPDFAADLGDLGGAIARGDELVLGRERLVVRRQGAVIAALERTDPGLGLLAPFG